MNPYRESKSFRPKSKTVPHVIKFGWPYKKTVAPLPETTVLRSVSEAVQLAMDHFGGLGSPLVFLDSVLRSASESPYRHPHDVYRLFNAMYELGVQWLEGDGCLGTSWELGFRRYGFDFRNKISQTTKGDFGHEYTFPYHGEMLLFEKHVTKGGKSKNNCLSVYFHIDKDRRCIAIAHCGNHPSNTSS